MSPMSEDRHAQPSAATAEPLYDVNIPTPTHAERARTLAAGIPTGTLCTLALEPDGCRRLVRDRRVRRGNPVFLMARWRNTRKPRAVRASCCRRARRLVRSRTGASRCSAPAPIDGDGGSARATEVHPNAAYADFATRVLAPARERDRYIGGYGLCRGSARATGAAAPDRSPHAAGAIAHMNADHADAMVLYCKAFSRATDVTSATMTGVDRYGFEMSATTGQGPRPVRVAFATPVGTPEELRAVLVAMVKDARSRLS